MSSVGTELPKEIDRLKSLISLYESQPYDAGMFAATMMKRDLSVAEKANANQDAVAMCRSLVVLREYED